MMNCCSRADLFQNDAPTKVQQSTFKCHNKRKYSEFTMQEANEINGVSTSKRARTIPTRCKRNFSHLIKYNQSEEEQVEEELFVPPRKKLRIALKSKKSKINKLKHFNFPSIQQTDPSEGTCVSISQRVRSTPARCKRNLSDLYKYNESKNKSPEEKCIKLTTCYLTKLSPTQSQDKVHKEREHDSEIDWCYDSSMDWRHDSEMDCWSYDSEMDWSYDSEMDWCYDSSMEWSYDIKYQQ